MFFEGLPCGHLLEATAKERQHDLLKGLSKAGKTEACRHRLSGRGAHLTVCSTVVILITRIKYYARSYSSSSCLYSSYYYCYSRFFFVVVQIRLIFIRLLILVLVLSTVTLRFFAYYYYCLKGPKGSGGSGCSSAAFGCVRA